MHLAEQYNNPLHHNTVLSYIVVNRYILYSFVYEPRFPIFGVTGRLDYSENPGYHITQFTNCIDLPHRFTHLLTVFKDTQDNILSICWKGIVAHTNLRTVKNIHKVDVLCERSWFFIEATSFIQPKNVDLYSMLTHKDFVYFFNYCTDRYQSTVNMILNVNCRKRSRKNSVHDNVLFIVGRSVVM